MKWLLVLIVLFSMSSLADDSQRFVMTEAHCKLYRQQALVVIASKQSGGTHPQYMRDRVDEYTKLTGMDRIVYLDMYPYIMEMAREYFEHDFDPSTPYEEVIYRHCKETVGNFAG